MNYEERKFFWETLCSLQGQSYTEDCKKLEKTIKYPRFLYRYRPVNMKNLEALRTNMLYFSSSNYYDDPFDTFLYIDIETIRNEIEVVSKDTSTLDFVIGLMKTYLRDKIISKQIEQLEIDNANKTLSIDIINKFLNFVMSSREDLKKEMWSVCFSENGCNESLWLKYADCHKGFVAIYDLEKTENLLCGKQDKCNNCVIKNIGTRLYPIYYTNKPYDATNFSKQILLRKIAEHINVPSCIQELFSPTFWEQERITLIKKECHKYDEEWRLLLGCNTHPPIMMEWIPSGVILGLHMKTEEENLVISMAKEAGIKNIYKAFISEKNELSYSIYRSFT